MRFSIATPTYNAKAYLPGCVASVRDQKDVSVEHIVQDGRSADGTKEWLASQPDLSWKSESDDGMYDALNRAFARADGDVLGWLTADEQYMPGAVRRAAETFDAHPDIGAVFGDCVVVDPTGKALSWRRELPFRRWYTVNGTLYVHSCALFFRRTVWEKSGGFRRDLKIAGDKEWILRIYDAGTRFLYEPFTFALFTATGNNLSLDTGLQRESEHIRRQFGAHRSIILRKLAVQCQHVEKLLRGRYRKKPVAFPFYNAVGERIQISDRLSSVWSWG